MKKLYQMVMWPLLLAKMCKILNQILKHRQTRLRVKKPKRKLNKSLKRSILVEGITKTTEPITTVPGTTKTRGSITAIGNILLGTINKNRKLTGPIDTRTNSSINRSRSTLATMTKPKGPTPAETAIHP